MAARFTEHQGDPAWLKAQREAQTRAMAQKTPRQQKAFPYPTVTPTSSDRGQFVQGATKDTSGAAASVIGFVVGYLMTRRRG